MSKLIIKGNNVLSGEINVSGAKNSAVALVPAALLSDGIVEIDNIPNISDIEALNEILNFLGAKVVRNNSSMVIDSSNIVNRKIEESLSTKLRASYYFMGALLGKYKFVEMYFPGGCNIGARPIDQTLKAFKALGAEIVEHENFFTVSAKVLKGNTIYLDMPSVGATINAMLAACKAEGTSYIENAAKEPEIVNVAIMLNNMGANITGAGTSTIKIVGVEKLGNTFVEVIPDRIEAGTYVIMGALIGNDLKIKNIIPEHIESLITKLREIHVPFEIGKDYIKVSCSNELLPVSIRTLGFPGFATDLQQPLTVLLTQIEGNSLLEETIYENRFQNVPYLNKMGAKIELIDNKNIIIRGKTEFIGCDVVATDLRAGAAMILAALKAKGTTTIHDIEHVLRGYENIVEKLSLIGAELELSEED